MNYYDKIFPLKDTQVHRPFDKTMRDRANEVFEAEMLCTFWNHFDPTSSEDNMQNARKAFNITAEKLINTGTGEDRERASQLFNDELNHISSDCKDVMLEVCKALLATISKLANKKTYAESYRRTFANQLKQLPYFKDLFSPESIHSDEYLFQGNKNTPVSRYTLNLHWETYPLIRAYCQTETQEFKNKQRELDDKKKAMLLDRYKDALKNESGEYFSLFRNTDPLYQHLVLKSLILEHIPERIILLLSTCSCIQL